MISYFSSMRVPTGRVLPSACLASSGLSTSPDLFAAGALDSPDLFAVGALVCEERFAAGAAVWEERFAAGAAVWEERFAAGAAVWEDRFAVGAAVWEDRFAAEGETAGFAWDGAGTIPEAGLLGTLGAPATDCDEGGIEGSLLSPGRLGVPLTAGGREPEDTRLGATFGMLTEFVRLWRPRAVKGNTDSPGCGIWAET